MATGTPAKMKSVTQIAILAALLVFPAYRIWALDPSSPEGGAAGLHQASPTSNPLSMRRSEDPRGQEPSDGVLEDISPGWEEETDDFEGFAIELRTPTVEPTGSQMASITPGRSVPPFLPPTRSSLLRC